MYKPGIGLLTLAADAAFNSGSTCLGIYMALFGANDATKVAGAFLTTVGTVYNVVRYRESGRRAPSTREGL